MNQSKDGFISFEEYVRFLSALTKGSFEDKARITFGLLEIDNHGFFVFEDVKSLLTTLMLKEGNSGFSLQNKVEVLAEYMFEKLKAKIGD